MSFMRRSELAIGLGRTMPERRPLASDFDATRQWKADDQAIVRVMQELIGVGAVHRISAGRRGWTATYHLCLGAPCTGTDLEPRSP